MNPAEQPSPSGRCLVIQTGGLGEVLQSLMALRAAQQLYPNLEFSLLVTETGAQAVRRVPWIRRVYAFPVDQLVQPLAQGTLTDSQASGLVSRWLGPVVERPWDFVVNWTYSDSSSFLCALIPGTVKLGYSRLPDGGISCSDGWSYYLQAIVKGGIPQDIHVTDVLTTQLLTALQIHLGEPVEAGEKAVTSKEFFTIELAGAHKFWRRYDSGQRWIAVQLPSGDASGAWSGQDWASFLALILTRHPHTSVVLLGKDGARPLAQAILAATTEDERHRVVSLAGETDFDLWASVISLCQWAVATEPAAIQLASVLGTRTFAMLRGKERLTEVGPYGNGHYVAQSRREGAFVTPVLAYAAWAYGNSEWSHQRSKDFPVHLRQLGWSEQAEGAQVCRTRIRPAEEGGGAFYEPLISNPLDSDAWFGMVMGHVARAWYCGWTPPLGQELDRARFDQDLVRQLRTLQDGAREMDKVLQEASALASRLAERSAKLRSDRLMGIADRREIEAMSLELSALDSRIEKLGESHEPIRAFARMARVMMHNLSGRRIAELARESADSYRQLREGLRILSDWLEHSLKLVRPMVISQTLKEHLREVDPTS